MKVGDLVRYDPGSTWTEKEKKDNCAIGLVIEVSYPDIRAAQVKWTSHHRDDASWETISNLELISASR